MSFDITVQGGTSVRLPTAGKYCDRDIVVTATVSEPESGYSESTMKSLLDRSITDFTVPAGTVSIGAYAFRNCSKLVSVEFPESVTAIATYAFAGCNKLAITELPAKITSISSYAFNTCRSLAITTLPESLTSIGASAFSSCSAIPMLTIPSGVTSIGSSAFYNCTGMSTLTFLGKPTTINTNSFDGCSNLTDIYVPWAEGEVANAPWGATNATIHYNVVDGMISFKINGTSYQAKAGMTWEEWVNSEYNTAGFTCNSYGYVVAYDGPVYLISGENVSSSMKVIGGYQYEQYSGDIV